jgi:putative transposase
MARAYRHYLPGQNWLLTHRCHEREFLLKFARDRQAWIRWLFEAKMRYGLCVLDYMVTSNHIHLLVYNDQERDTIPDSIQLVAGRSAQSYNQRKNRRGAYWEDRYHATAVETGRHLRQCLAYIDLNMVRAGVVTHPKFWPHCGYAEIQQAKARYRIINSDKLMELVGVGSLSQLQELCQSQVEAELRQRLLMRQSHWTESVAVGGLEYVETIQRQMGIQAKGREVRLIEGGCQLREGEATYQSVFEGENGILSDNNRHFWNKSIYLSTS